MCRAMSSGLIGIPLKGARGGHFDDLQKEQQFAPGEPAHSAEGWVVFASNLDPDVTEEDIKDFFSTFGKIHVCRYLIDARSCGCLGCAAVEYLSYDSALAAVQKGNGVAFVNDRPISIAFAFVVPQPDEDEEEDPLESVVRQHPVRRHRTRDEEAELENLRAIERDAAAKAIADAEREAEEAAAAAAAAAAAEAAGEAAEGADGSAAAPGGEAENDGDADAIA